MPIKITASAALVAILAAGLAHAAETTEATVTTPAEESDSAPGLLDNIDTSAFQAATQRAVDDAATPQNQQRAQRRNRGGHSKGGFVDRYDTDGDGEVGLAEFVAERNAGYARRDFNGDGMVHQEEYVSEYEIRLEQQLEERRERSIEAANFRFSVMDTDDDEAMSIDEFHASSKMMFTRLDTNEDGIVNDEDTAERF